MCKKRLESKLESVENINFFLIYEFLNDFIGEINGFFDFRKFYIIVLTYLLSSLKSCIFSR